MSILIYILLAIHVIVSLLIILVTLMQRPKNDGLGAAFGGGMTENLFGAQTTNVLSTFTRWLGGTFFALTLLLSVLYARQSSSKSPIQQQLLPTSGAAAASPAASVVPSAAVSTGSAAASASESPAASPSAESSATPAPTASPEASPSAQASSSPESTPAPSASKP